MPYFTRETFPTKETINAIPHTTRMTPAVGNPSNVQTFRIEYQYGVYVIISIDINNYYDTTMGSGTGVPGDYPWLMDWKLYQNSTQLYGFNDLSSIVLESQNGTYPFNDPNNMTLDPGVAFWTYDSNVDAHYYNLMSIYSLGYNDLYANTVAYNYPCFKEGSKILTDNGYRAVETLRKGDKVMTYYHGLKAIDMIGRREIFHPATEERIKDQLYKCSPEQYSDLEEDLIITGAHSILVTDFKDNEERAASVKVNGDFYVTDGKGRLPACVDERAMVYEVPGTYTIYHFALEHPNYYMNYGVYANGGLLVETTSKRYMKELSNMTLLE